MASSTDEDTLLYAGLGSYDSNVIPPYHDARTLVVCFDGTGDQFNADVRAYMMLPLSVHVQLAHHVPFRIPTSYSFSLC